MIQKKKALINEVRAEYLNLQDSHSNKSARIERLPLKTARLQRYTTNWKVFNPMIPKFLGRRYLENYSLSELIRTIDWTPFFRTWELTGTFPTILKDVTVGEEARKLYQDAQEMLQRIVHNNWLRACAVIGFFPANSVGDDIEVYSNDNRSKPTTTFHFLRQQMVKREGQPNYCLSDFVAPKDSEIEDYIGAFAVTTGLGIEKKLAQFQIDHDAYSNILLKALADRLAEAFAERLHERARTEFWSYAPIENLSNDDLISENYIGIRPAPGYPACPDHSEKLLLFDLLQVEKISGFRLTENFAMQPAASVSGFYFAHPESRYFGLGRIGKDQAIDYAKRRCVDLSTVEKLLAPNLSY